MRFTKTEIQLIEEAHKNHMGLVSAEKFVGRGPEGGRVNYGKRRHSALSRLIRDGIFEQVDRSSSLQTENGYGINCYMIVAKLPK